MKTQNNFFRNLSTVVLMMVLVLTAACGSDDDGAVVPVEQFVALPAEVLTTFPGTLSYTAGDGTLIIADVPGTATISVSGTNHTISFSNDVPSITGIRFLGSSNGNYASIGTSGSVAGIVIEGNELTVGAVINGNSWSFNPN